MLKIILLTLLSVAILTLGGEMLHGLTVCINTHGLHNTLIEYVVNSFGNIRWEQVTSNIFVSAFTILVCLRFFDQLSHKNYKK